MIYKAIFGTLLSATLLIVGVEPVIEAGNHMIAELNQIGRTERTRQQQICELVEECKGVAPWVDAPPLTNKEITK